MVFVDGEVCPNNSFRIIPSYGSYSVTINWRALQGIYSYYDKIFFFIEDESKTCYNLYKMEIGNVLDTFDNDPHQEEKYIEGELDIVISSSDERVKPFKVNKEYIKHPF